MPMKEWIYQLQPVQLYVILTLSICYFILQLFLSHITHALTLLIDSYHMLCNVIALTGCIITIKHSKKIQEYRSKVEVKEAKSDVQFGEVCLDTKTPVSAVSHSQDSKMYNTFGWTRIDILTMLIVCIFLASLSFSLLVEALQTLIHIDHQDTMHLPVPVFILGAMGLILNGLCYLLIGGYTLRQGSFFHVTSSGDVVLENVSSAEDLKGGDDGLSKTKRDPNQDIIDDMGGAYFQPGQRQGPCEMFRDVCSTIFVMICAAIVYFANNEQVSKFIDPVISIISCIILLVMSYPYMKESCLILLQTIPASIDIEQFKASLLAKFSEIVSVHDLHVWQLTSRKYVSTVHIIFRDPLIYAKTIEDVKNFFHEQGITNVTIQPEFKDTHLTPVVQDCYLQCSDVACAEKHCCLLPVPPAAVVIQSDKAKSCPPEASEKTKNVSMEKSKSSIDINSEKVAEFMDPDKSRLTVSDSHLDHLEPDEKQCPEIIDKHVKTDKEIEDNDVK